MKKILSILLVAAMAVPAMAAREKETPEQRAQKDYSTWMPAEGDFSVGFALDPLATFVGNLLSGYTGQNSLDKLAGDPLLKKTIGANPMVSVMGSYMFTDKLGLKANIGLGLTSKAENHYVLDDEALYLDPLSKAKVVDSRKANLTYGSIAVGVEYRVGKTRPVQGVFGGGVNYAFGQRTYRFNYGNAITEMNQTPTISADASTSTFIPTPTYSATAGYMPNARLLSSQADKLIHMIGVYGSVGVEWFVAPKIALGANVNVGLYYEVNPSRTSIYEGWNMQTKQVEKFTEQVAPASHGFHFGTDNIGANLYIAFYFNKDK